MLHILHHAREEPIFGLEIIRELARHGYDISPGTLYPTLHRLEREGLLSSRKSLIDGHVRKYYTITPAGEELLGAVRPKLQELVDEVLPRDKRDDREVIERPGHIGDS